MKPLAIKLPTNNFTLAPIGCIHWPIGEKDMLKEWVEAIRSRPHVYTILMGDTFDQERSHYRKHLHSYTDDENSQEAYDGYVREEVHKLAKVLAPIKSRIWGVIRGNHYHDYMDGTNTEQDLCRLLGLKYLGAAAAFRVTTPVCGTSSANLVVLAHHSGGSMGGRTTSGDVAALTKLEAGFDADIYIAGHTHRRHAHKEAVLTLNRKGDPRIVDRTRVFIRCGAFLKGFREDSPTVDRRHVPSYAEEKMLRPTDLGWVELDVRWKSRRDDNLKAYYPEYKLTY